jgi:N-acetylglucosaminyldiphosphoundecaprenol N-acetyl-beta-D-mannosaminyltransferase
MEHKKINILDVPILHINNGDFIELLDQRIQNKVKTFVVTANPEIVMKANKETLYRSYLQRADFITADGIGIVMASKILNKSLPGRVTGYDMMLDLLERADKNQYRVYFLGAEPSILELFLKKVKARYPQVEIVGSHNGFFDWHDNNIKEDIQALEPDLIFVALGVPRQEQWIVEHYDSFQKGIFIGVGGSFDVMAGVVKRAPEIWQKLNLEWFYRLLNQPSRWRRMLAIPQFVLKVFGQKFGGK